MNIVFIPNVDLGNNRNTPYHYSIKSWKKWAEQYDDVKVIEWDEPIMDPNQFKIAHDKIVKKFKKQFEGRFVAFGTYDINYPNGATHWVAVSGESDHEHVMLYDELQKQSEFIKLLGERGKVEDVKDFMVTSLKTY